MTAAGLQEELDIFDEWCDENNCQLHTDKASVLWCSLNNRAIREQMLDLKIASKVIKRDYHLRLPWDCF